MQIAAVARRASAVLHHTISSGRGFPNGGLLFQLDTLNSKSVSASFCSVAVAADGDDAKGLHDKILESVKVKRSAPPNAWLWSFIEKCNTRDDINLLFETLQQLRIFRLSYLRIPDNFNSNLCQEVTKACIRAEALDFGKKALWKHNVYGLSPTIGSVNQLLSYAKDKKYVKFMKDVMTHLKKNEIPLQPATADIVFSICSDADNWELISKYATMFIKAGVKLRKTSFATWLDFAARKGDLKSLKKIEEMRSTLYDKHTVKSAFACCKGLLLENKPHEASTLITDLVEKFPVEKREDIFAELQKLFRELPTDDKAFFMSLNDSIPIMMKALPGTGVDSRINITES